MIIPAFTVLALLAVIFPICMVTLWLTRWPGFGVATLLCFIIGAFLGEILFFKVYGRLYADSHGQLTSRSQVMHMFAWIPVIAAISGWLGAATSKLAMDYIDAAPEDHG